MFNKLKKVKILTKDKYKNIVVIAEFKHTNDTLAIISELSKYMHDICSKTDIITTDIQYFQAGYRVTFKLKYIKHKYFKFRNINYFKKLAKVSDWLSKFPQSQTLIRYHYNINVTDVF